MVSEQSDKLKVRFCVNWHAIKQVKEKVRTMVIATRELHGVVMDPEQVALAWYVRFAGQIISRTVKGADGLTAFQREFQRASHLRSMPSAWREKILYLEASNKKIQTTDKFLDGILLGIKEGSEKFIVGTRAGCVVAELSKDGLVKTLQIPSFSTAVVERPGDCCQMTNRENPENPESYRCELMCIVY